MGGPHNWRMLSSSVVGSGHVARGVGCEDFHSIAQLTDGAWIAVAADGAGSARHAAEASKLVALEAKQFLATQLPKLALTDESAHRSLMGACLHHARTAIEALAAQDGEQSSRENLSQFATTLLAVCVDKEWISVLQLGDGAIVLRNMTGSLSLACKPVHGEYINETQFLTSPDFDQHAQYFVTRAAEIDAIAIFTDGIELLALNYPASTPHRPFFDPMFSFAAAPDATDTGVEEFLKSDRVCDRTDDDKTLIIAVRR